MVGIPMRRSIRSEDQVHAPDAPARDELRDAFFSDISRLTGVVHARGRSLRLGPLTLLRFGQPIFEDGSWSWPIAGGLLARSAGGTLRFGWKEGVLTGAVDGYHPLLPLFVHRLTQAPVHHLVTRLFLLRLRGPAPVPGRPASALRRQAAAAIDAAILVLPVRALARRSGPARAMAAGAVGAYLLAGWAAGGTPGQRLAGTRLLAWDGTNPTWEQALVRLAAVPAALAAGRPLHDRAACTTLVRRGGVAAG